MGLWGNFSLSNCSGYNLFIYINFPLELSFRNISPPIIQFLVWNGNIIREIMQTFERTYIFLSIAINGVNLNPGLFITTNTICVLLLDTLKKQEFKGWKLCGVCLPGGTKYWIQLIFFFLLIVFRNIWNLDKNYIFSLRINRRGMVFSAWCK